MHRPRNWFEMAMVVAALLYCTYLAAVARGPMTPLMVWIVFVGLGYALWRVRQAFGHAI